MSLALKIEVKESISSLMRMSIPMISIRINMLILLKKHDGCISRRKLASKLGVCATCIQTWRNIYLHGGLKSLISHEKKGKFSVPKSGNFLNKHCRIPEKDTENSRN